MCERKVVVGSGSIPLAQIVAGYVYDHSREHEVHLAHTFEELREKIRDTDPYLVLLDARSSDSAAHLLMGTLHSEFPNARLAMWSFEAMTREEAVRFLLFGAIGCCNFRYDIDAQDTGIGNLLEGKDYITKEIAGVYEKALDSIEEFGLTAREHEVYLHLIQGKKTKVIARYLNCAETTVLAHKRSLYKKYGVSNSGELMRIAFDRGDLRSLDSFGKAAFQHHCENCRAVKEAA
jgi:two-component system nitrate/nitrite response regulator NarL